jgi:hypothetical protein
MWCLEGSFNYNPLIYFFIFKKVMFYRYLTMHIERVCTTNFIHINSKKFHQTSRKNAWGIV